MQSKSDISANILTTALMCDMSDVQVFYAYPALAILILFAGGYSYRVIDNSQLSSIMRWFYLMLIWALAGGIAFGLLLFVCSVFE